MTGGFSFPPPPPPPPKAASSAVPPPPPTQQAGRGGRGGGRGGRGNFRGRGDQSQHQRGGRQQSNRYNGSQNSNQYNGSAPSANYPDQPNYGNMPFGQQQQQSCPVPPPGAYVNPAFNMHQQYQHQQQQQHQYIQYQSAQQAEPQRFSPNQKRTRDQAFGGHGQNRHPMKKPASAPKVQAAPAVPSFGAPLPLPPKPAQAVAESTRSAASSKKRVNLFGLTPDGGVEEALAAESGDEDVDEEAAAASNVSSGPMKVEYNGEVYDLTSPAELAEWIAERKKCYPTKRRVEEKKVEVQKRMEERKRIEEETRAAAAAADPLSGLARTLPPAPRERPRDREKDRQKLWRQRDSATVKQEFEASTEKPSEPDGAPIQPGQGESLDEARRELEKQMLKVQQLQELLAESEAKAAAMAGGSTAENGLPQPMSVAETAPSPAKQGEKNDKLAEGEAGGAALQALLNHLSEPGQPNPEAVPLVTEVPEAEPKSPGALHEQPQGVPHDSDSSEDEAPEEATSKSNGPVRVPPPNSERRICQTFATTGRCKYGPKCKFKHVGSEATRVARNETAPTKRKTLFQRMVEQEREEENRIALLAIKHLGSVGFFSKRE